MSRLSSVLFAASLTLPFTACISMDEGEFDSSSDQAATGELGLHGAPEHLMHGRGEAGRPSKDPHLTFHGGQILQSAKTVAIFWGNWTDPAIAQDKVAGLDEFFTGFGGSNFANTNTEYTGSNGQVTNGSTYQGHAFDSTTAPSKALSVSQAVSEACKFASQSDDPANTVYFIYTSTGAGHVNYCAWHSYGTCNGKTIQVAYMPNIDGIAGCDPGNPYSTTGLQGLRALANVTAHELSEAITDPHLDAWTDNGGAENSDKCAWHWDGPVTLGTRSWMVQMNWSNAAYDLGITHDGVKGCIQSEAAQYVDTLDGGWQ